MNEQHLHNNLKQIVKEILNFGVTEDQKIDIMYLIAVSIQDNKNMKEITSFLSTYQTKINEDEKHGVSEDDILRNIKTSRNMIKICISTLSESS